MSRILIAAVPLLGHVRPGLPIARELVKRGHEVFFYTGAKYRAEVEAVGARFAGMRQARDFDDAELPAAFPELQGLRGFAQMKLGMELLFVDPIPNQVADLHSLRAEHGFDVMVHDVCFTGMPLYAERYGVPYVTYGISALAFPSRDTAPFGLALPPSASTLGRLRNRALYALTDRVIFRRHNARYRAMRRELGLHADIRETFLGAPIRAQAYLQTSVPSFDYPRSDMPSVLEFVGPFLLEPGRAFEAPRWWSELDGTRPVVHVTQGTVSTNASDLLVPTLHALADEDVLVVATTGGAPVQSLGALPSNARVERFIEYMHLLPHVDVMVTNGGYGGVGTALAHGVPMVVAGDTEEKPEVARRIGWSGVGIDLRSGRPSERRIRDAVRRVLREPSFRQRAQAMQREIAGYAGARRAADVVEQVAGSATISSAA